MTLADWELVTSWNLHEEASRILQGLRSRNPLCFLSSAQESSEEGVQLAGSLASDC